MASSINSKVFHEEEEEEEATQGQAEELQRDDLHSSEKVFVDKRRRWRSGASIQLLFGTQNITFILFFLLEWKVSHALLCAEGVYGPVGF